MKFAEFIEKHHIFTTAGLFSTVESSKAAREQLRLAVKKGTVKSVRRGLYVSQKGYFEGKEPNPFRVAWVADSECVFFLHSALELYGVSHNVFFECAFQSAQVLKGFSFGSVHYKPFPKRNISQTQLMHREDFSFRVTTKEQTLLDCLERPSYAGGLEEVLRSVSAFIYLDFEALEELAQNASDTLCARLGWLLEVKKDDWHIPGVFLETLHGRLHSGPYLFGSAKDPRISFSKKWRLYFPEEIGEILSWIQG